MLMRYPKQAFTLIEMMMAVAISSFLLLGLIGLYVANSSHNKLILQDAKLDVTIQAVSSLIEADIANAGYWGNAGSSISNPFVLNGSTYHVTVSPANDCIKLTYDKNDDGSLPSISSSYDDERYGYRLSNNAIQYRPWGASFDCAAASTAWTNLTDPNVISIQALSFTPEYYSEDIDGAGAGTTEIRIGYVTVSITAANADDASNTKTYTRTVRMRNDQYVP
jgi:prepilin-type N-terminal cleavage/methylation domain-containing protein